MTLLYWECHLIPIKVTFETHLRSVSRTASQRLCILRKSWRVFHDRLLLSRCFRGFVLAVWSTVLQCGARLPIHTLNFWTVQSVLPDFLTGCVFECDNTHRRSSAVFCMLYIMYKIRCNPMHPFTELYQSPYVPVSVTRGA